MAITPSCPPAMSAEHLCVFINMALPQRILVGLSGGADSVALAYLLLREDVDLRAVHVNHGLRGEASDGDEAFVRQLCREWSLPLDVYRATLPEHPGEDWARQARYGFYRQAMEKHGADAVALAHHRDDQAETFLLHLLRGAGLTGLTGMEQDVQVLGVRVIRPLLGASRQELRDLLTQAGIPWREDESNQDTRYLRNALRCQVLPMMEQLAPGATGRIAATAGLLRLDEAALSEQAEVMAAGEPYIPLNRLNDLPSGLLHRVLRRWWQRCATPREESNLSRQQTEALASLVKGMPGSKCNLPMGWQGYRGWTHLHLRGGELSCSVRLNVSDGAASHGDGRKTQAMPRVLYDQCVVRTRQPGDWISPYGQCGRQSLQDYFVNRRVDAPFRDCVPLLCLGSQVLLAAGVGAGAVPAFDPAKDYVMLSWMGEMPWMQKKGGTTWNGMQSSMTTCPRCL